MRLELTSTTVPLQVAAGSPAKPVDVTVQNTNAANAVYLSYSQIDATTKGLKLDAGQSYTNTALTRPLYILPTAATDVVNVEIQDSVLGMIMQLLAVQKR